MVEDFARNRPSLVFIDDRAKKSYFGEVEFDYVSFLLEDPKFAEMWQDFQQIDRVAGYKVWKRAGVHGFDE